MTDIPVLVPNFVFGQHLYSELTASPKTNQKAHVNPKSKNVFFFLYPKMSSTRLRVFIETILRQLFGFVFCF